ncbi:MAG: dephospho-CoA kinase [Bacteroidia bacterium]|nr:dephospho-CoA kinase [Bacteroidia bacterium]
MKIVGITGGIGSGKSVVCKVFEQLGIPVYEADSAAKLLYDKYPELKQSIKELVSEDAIDKNGNINKKKLAEIVFNNDEKLAVLNKLVHPLVKLDFKNWVESHKGFPYLIKEAAILFESGANKDCDIVITVVSPIELRVERVRQRDKKTKAEIEAIISRQLSEEELIKRSDFVIYNDEKQMVIPQVLKVHEGLSKQAL